jgi:hypothetical protein
VAKIQRDTKIGTAYEKYDTRFLWKLGDSLQSYSGVAQNKEDSVAEVLLYLSESNIRCPPVLLKNAETARRSWQNEKEYLNDAKDVSYGKLKAILPFIDPDFVMQTRLPDTERRSLLKNLNQTTYKDVLAKVRELRQDYDPLSISIDLDQFYSDLHYMNSYLESAILGKDAETLTLFRKRYSQKMINDVRMLLAAVRSEDTLKKLEKTLPKGINETPSNENEVDRWLLDIAQALVTLRRGTPSSRERTRQRIGVSKLGELSTLLKAASSDEELERYKRAQELLEKIRSPSFGQ